MIEEKYLCDFRGYKVKTKISLQSIRKKKGDFVAQALSAVINVESRNKLIVEQYQKLAPGSKAIAFCVTVRHAKQLCEEFMLRGIRCECLHSDMVDVTRRKILSQFKSGEIKVLTNCNLLTEGFDEPSITCLLMCRPTMSKGLYTQMIGRGSRIFPGKKECIVIEFTDNDFDVCDMSSLISTLPRQMPMYDNETLTEYSARIPKELLISEGEAVVVEHTPIPNDSYTTRLASPWQIDKLKELGISFVEPLYEFSANYLLTKER